MTENKSLCLLMTSGVNYSVRWSAETTIKFKMNWLYSNLLSFLLRCSTSMYKWGTQWDSNRFVKVCLSYLPTIIPHKALRSVVWTNDYMLLQIKREKSNLLLTVNLRWIKHESYTHTNGHKHTHTHAYIYIYTKIISKK